MKAIISGGGTGGHIYPGIAISKELIERYKDIEILYIGTKNGLEERIVPKEGIKIEYITVEGLNKKFSLGTFSSLIKGLKGYKQASKIIKEFKPDVVVGTGGYVCGPVVLAASLKNIPTLIHEQNAFPGMTNKILSKFVNKIAISFLESERYFPKNKTVFTGNPIRREILNVNREMGRKKIGFSKDYPLIIVVGGSRGALNINKAVANALSFFEENKIQILFITGESQYNDILNLIKEKGFDAAGSNFVKVVPYMYNIQDVLGSCDLIISRAGATILSEITALGIPSILIPSPYVANNHQEFNAKVLEKNGAAILIHEEQLKGEILSEEINNIIFNNDILTKMKTNSKNLANIDAAEKICDIIDELLFPL